MGLPFVTTDLNYINDQRSFIMKRPDEYDLVVRYKLKKGTITTLETVGLKSGTSGSKETQTLEAKHIPLVKREGSGRITGGALNFGFRTQETVRIHLKPKAIGSPEIIWRR
ncbi:hypothetical protein [Xanthocytophaga agilis]|uniref:Uncharacterized protein n=1 Tax=Xanthocytophaga agilis TaxID=3048010 RepID=A0AAE3REN1_9BACT|nr:hypothetical protein [Xanthocytophaga agilis]MDJ1506843.1 hypothetical protein [Xanthocytophaga agilis]